MAAQKALVPEIPYKPMKDLLLVMPMSGERGEVKTEGGIIISGRSPDAKYEFAVVVAAGEGAISTYTGARIPMDVMVGDEVAHVERAGWEFRWAGKLYRVIRETDVWLVLNPYGAHRKAKQ